VGSFASSSAKGNVHGGPRLASGLWFAMRRTRAAHTARSAPHPGLSLAGASSSKNLVLYVCFAISEDALPPPCIVAARRTSAASSGISLLQPPPPLFHRSDVSAWGHPRGAFVGHPGCRAQRGHRKTESFNAKQRSRRFGESFYSLQSIGELGRTGMQTERGLLNSRRDKRALSSPISHPGSCPSRSESCVTGRGFGFVGTTPDFRTAHATRTRGGQKLRAARGWLTGRGRAVGISQRL